LLTRAKQRGQSEKGTDAAPTAPALADLIAKKKKKSTLKFN
jgi:hypothetical protein